MSDKPVIADVNDRRNFCWKIPASVAQFSAK